MAIDKKLLFAMLLSTATVFGLQYFFGGSSSKDQTNAGQLVPGQGLRAPLTTEVKPLKREVDFVDTAMTEEEDLIIVETPLVKATFSNYGAILKHLEFLKHRGKSRAPLNTIISPEREDGVFLLALDEKTPLLWQLKSREDLGGVTRIVYEAAVSGWRFSKTYLVHHDNYKIDLDVAANPEQDDVAPCSLRLLMSGPRIEEISDDAPQGFVTKPNGSTIEKVETAKEAEWFWIQPALCGVDNKYFAHALVADQQKFAKRAYFKRTPDNRLQLVLEAAELATAGSWKLSFYMGPKVVQDLDNVDSRLEGLLTFGWLSWLCKFLLSLLEMLYHLVGNYGYAIILLTIAVKIPFFPLTVRGKQRMEEYQRFQPALNRIRLKYRHDMAKQNEEIMKFHKEHNLSPTAHMLGCLPLLIQLPILFALYRVLNNYVALYQAPFLGWITDLSAKDPYFVLPIVMGLSMLWQQLITPVGDEKQRVVMIFMSFVMMALFINFPAGLVLYWFMNNLIGIAEDYFRKKFFA